MITGLFRLIMMISRLPKICRIKYYEQFIQGGGIGFLMKY